MLKLYFSPSSSSLATHIALIEAGAPFELIPRLITKQETRTPEYLGLNPDGKVPALVIDGGRILTEVAGTLYYIARRYPAVRFAARSGCSTGVRGMSRTVPGIHSCGPGRCEGLAVTTGQSKAAGMTATTVRATPFSTSCRPTIDRSPPKRRIQSP